MKANHDHTPAPFKEAFRCPHCRVVSKQRQCSPLFYESPPHGNSVVSDLSITRCDYCHSYTYWHNRELIYPQVSLAPEASSDMPEEVKKDFDEARLVAKMSPRSAAALLRLALQKLLIYLGAKGKKIDDDIKQLVKNGLPAGVQKAMDSVRVIGNNAVHPGQMDLQDNPETALSLFRLLNYVVEQMITQPKHLEDVYGGLPQGAKESIAQRDQNANARTP